jgi:ribosomal-protein-alanine N-acetyltransferase
MLTSSVDDTIGNSTVYARQLLSQGRVVKPMIVVETERLILRHFHIFDVEAMNRVFGDAEVMRFGPGVQTTLWVQDWLRGCLENYYQKWGFGKWAVVEKSKRETIGYCGLSYLPDLLGQPEIDIGYRLVRSVWGRGYATEAVLAVRDYSFNVPCLPRLIAMIDPQNVASIRVAEKAGMRYETEVMFEGYTHPDHVYSISNSMRV